MRINRFIGKFDVYRESLCLNDAALVHQLRDVLRLTTGESIVLCDGQGAEALFSISEYGKNSVTVTRVRQPEARSEQNILPVLYCAVLKKENFELVAQKATEIGVSRIVPVITKRTVKLNIRTDRLEKIVREAAEQSGHAVVPQISEPVVFKDAVVQVQGQKFLFDSSGSDPEALAGTPCPNLFIGPEGGWDEEEIHFAREHGFSILALGEYTLRAETAAIVAVFLARPVSD